MVVVAGAAGEGEKKIWYIWCGGRSVGRPISSTLPGEPWGGERRVRTALDGRGGGGGRVREQPGVWRWMGSGYKSGWERGSRQLVSEH